MLSFRQNKQNRHRSSIWCHIAALLFSFFMVFGRSFERTDSWSLVMDGGPNQLYSLASGVCWYLVFFVGISCLFRFLDKVFLSDRAASTQKESSGFFGILKNLGRKYMNLLSRFPVLVTACTILAANIPYMVLSYPAVFMGDTGYQLSQGFFETEYTNHHPIVHTLLLSLFLRIGEWIGSCNIGIFLYSLTQTIFLCLIIGCAIRILIELHTSRVIIASILIYYCIHPRISSYFFLTAKDVFYAAFMTLFYLSFFRLMQDTLPCRKRDLIVFALSIAGVIMFRNDGKYIVILTLLAALFYQPIRRKALAFLAVGAAASLSVTGILMPLMEVEPGSSREMLSVPFQQTARYVRDAGGDLTAEEIETIDRVLDFQSLAQNYNPDISDPVKSTYKEDDEALPDYFRVWFRQFLRHPGIYIQATMNNYYQYFYPGYTALGYFGYGWSEEQMKTLNRMLKTDYSMPEALREARLAFEIIREDISNLSPLFLLKSPAFYTWTALLFLFYCLWKKNLRGILFGMPIIVQFLIFITGPTNGYYCRYEYPMLIYLPVILVLGLRLLRESPEQSQ